MNPEAAKAPVCYLLPPTAWLSSEPSYNWRGGGVVKCLHLLTCPFEQLNLMLLQPPSGHLILPSLPLDALLYPSSADYRELCFQIADFPSIFQVLSYTRASTGSPGPQGPPGHSPHSIPLCGISQVLAAPAQRWEHLGNSSCHIQ